MITLSDLGLEPATSAATQAAAEVVPNQTTGPLALVPGSILAKVLYAVFSRQPVCIVDSPPGSGKTQLLIDVLGHLMVRSDFKVIVACPTRRGVVDLSGRLARAFQELGETDPPEVVVSVSGLKSHDLPEGVRVTASPQSKRSVVIRTVDSCAFNPPTCDLMFFDEAYQTTFAKVATAADAADQVVMVGDPGQIGPVVTANVSAWSRTKNAPHRRAPEVFAGREDATVLQMNATYRLGEATVEAISPLYGFSFTSKRPDRHLTTADSSPLPELSFTRITPAASVADIGPLRTVAQRAVDLVGTHLVTTEDQGEPYQLEAADVAVVVSHNVQASGVAAILRSQGYEDITVGTADRMQGGQWHAVVALDPLVGHASTSPHQLSSGRLCVMASRHLTHLTWIGDGNEFSKLSALADGDDPDHDAKVGIVVRQHLIGST